MQDDSGESEKRIDRLKRRAFLGTTAAGLSLPLAGCSGSSDDTPDSSDESSSGTDTTTSSESDITKGGRLIWSHSEQAIGMDAHTTAGESSFRVLCNIHEPLIGLDEELNLSTDPDAEQPGLARDFSVSDDATTFTFELREGINFHNGDTLTADDVRYTFERIMNPDLGANFGFIFDRIESIDVIDDLTIETTLNAPFRRFAGMCAYTASSIIPEGTGEQQSDQPIGAGPFTFRERNVGETIIMDAFDDYWNEGPYVDVLEQRTMTEPESRLSSVTTGDAHITNDIPVPDIGTVTGDSSDDVTTKSWNPLCVAFIMHNTTKAPFDSQNWRLAVDYAIDKQQLVDGAIFGNGEPTEVGVFPNSKYRNNSLERRELDLDQASQLLEESEYDPANYPLEFKVSPNYPWHVEAATIMIQSLTQAGFNIEIQQLQWAEYLEQVASGTYDISFVNWFEGWDPAYWLRNVFYSSGSYNWTGYDSSAFDEAMDAAAAASSDDAAVSHYQEAQRHRHENLPANIVWYREGALAAKNSVGGLDTVPTPDKSLFRFEEIWQDQ